MSDRVDILFELGTEELPPRSLVKLASSLAISLTADLESAQLADSDTTSHWYASPRRLAVRIDSVMAAQEDRSEQRLGPPVAAAFDGDGQPRPAAAGFAASNGIAVEALERVMTDKGERIAATRHVPGESLKSLLPDMVDRAVANLPIPKPMRWGTTTHQFVRPVHWALLIADGDVVTGELLGQPFGNETRGHRFHAPERRVITHPDDYLESLRAGYVVVDFEERRESIRRAIVSAAESLDRHAVIDDDLLDEVTNLVEWPQAIIGQFDPEFLDIPSEVLISSMAVHQKFFPLKREDQSLDHRFVAIANIESRDPEKVRSGYNRVIRPRLADAQFFYRTDLKTPLQDRRAGLERMVYQRQLGTLADKCTRVENLAANLAERLDMAVDTVRRAAYLAKCDLMTLMVGEFPELQGVIGRYYALSQGEPDEVAWAIEEHYLPRHAGDCLPRNAAGMIIGIAERLDTLVGIFAVGLKPSGSKDPFALRRAALGLGRLLIEGQMELDLAEMVSLAADQLPQDIESGASLVDDVVGFVLDRLRVYFQEQGIDPSVVTAVYGSGSTTPLDISGRVRACQQFLKFDSAEALAAANKRIGNILRKSETEIGIGHVDRERLAEDGEVDLMAAVDAVSNEVQAALDEADYGAALSKLATLRQPIDQFFDSVMVNADDPAVRHNRLSLLAEIKARFDAIADISELAQAR